MSELKYLFLKAKLENESKNLDRDEFHKIVEDKIGWTEYNEILRDSVRNSLLDSATHNSLTKLGEIRLHELEHNLLENKKDREAERKQLHNKTIISGWKRKTFWWIFGLAIIGSGLSIYNFTNNLGTKRSKIELEKRIENIESKFDSTPAFDSSQKTNDSLPSDEESNFIDSKK